MENLARPMDDAERQRTMDFILRQQAQLAVSAQRGEEEHARLRRVVVMMARQFRQDRSDLKERIAALINAQMQSEERQARAEDRQARTEEWQARAEERQARTEEWQAQMEESFARSDARMTRLEEEAERSSAAIAKLAASTDRNSEAIAKLTDVVADIAQRRNGDKDSA